MTNPAEPLCCIPRRLPDDQRFAAAQASIAIRPENHPLIGPNSGPLRKTTDDPATVTPQRIAFESTSYWGSGGVHLTVGFMEPCPADLAARILSHANAWSKRANVKFSLSNTDPQVRITRETGGYASYVGTAILHVPATEPTMWLEGYTMQVTEEEFRRVVRHEMCHTLGADHEHMRAQIVALIDPNKAVRYFHLTQGWSRQEVMQQVLTPITEDNFVFATPNAEQDSIMCYQLPAQIMKNGIAVPGGTDITEEDYDAAAIIYPLQVA